MSTTTSTNAGSLTIAGSGIASVAHITLETLSHIKEADKVFYVVCDPATEVFIHDNAKAEAVNLTIYYDTNKIRYDSYVQMAEVMLQDVRGGKNVLGIFYGHPGVFVSPSHRALAIARSEGYKAKMLPGVSAEDYLFADLEFDPSVHGCATFEATELLIKEKPLNPMMHNIIWQVGAVGVDNMIFNNAKFHVLVDRLEKDFGPEHQVVHYIGAILPGMRSVMDTFAIADLHKEDVVSQFNPSSTLYIPPRSFASNSSEVAVSLGSIPGCPLDEPTRFPPLRWTKTTSPVAPAYGPVEKAAIAQLANYKAPSQHKVLVASPALRKLITELNASPALRTKLAADPKAFASAIEGLTEVEKLAVETGNIGTMIAVMKTLPGREQSVDLLTSLDTNVQAVILLLIFQSK